MFRGVQRVAGDNRARTISLGSLSHDPRSTCGAAGLRHLGSSVRERPWLPAGAPPVGHV